MRLAHGPWTGFGLAGVDGGSLLVALFACQSPPDYRLAAVAVPARAVDVLSRPVIAGAPLAIEEKVRATDNPAVQRVTIRRDTRSALVGGDGSRWAMTVRSDSPSRLLASVGRLEGSPCFRVWINEAAESKGCLSPKQGWTGVRETLPAGESRIVLQIDGGAAAWGDPRVVPVADDPRPDVVLLIFDTTRPDHLGFGGYTRRTTTPGLDAWLADATVYTAARASSPWTAPSIGSILTGLSPAGHGAGARRIAEEEQGLSDAEQKARAYAAMIEGVPTLATRLRDAGYDTVAVSANGFFGYRNALDRGFSRFVSYSGSDWEGGREGAAVVEKLLAKRDRGSPALVALHFVDPHHPYTLRLPPPAGYEAPTDLKLDAASEGKRTAVRSPGPNADGRRHPESLKALYDAEIRWVDDALASVLRVIEDDAIVVGVADHGEGFGEHGSFMHGNTLYEELLRVPLFVRLPGQAGRVDTPVSIEDITPTILTHLGLPLEGLTGRVLPGPGASSEPRVFFAESMYTGADRTAAFDGRWKYIYTHASGGGDRSPRGLQKPKAAVEELFDLSVDPVELVELSGEAPTDLARLRQATFAHLAATWPGVHVSCQPNGPMSVRIGAEGVIGRVGPLSLEEEDTSRIIRNELRFDALPAGPGDTDWLVFLLGGPGTVRFSGWPGAPEGVSVGGGAGTRLPTGPPVAPPAPGTCNVWEVVGVGAAPVIDADDLAELRELGYVE